MSTPVLVLYVQFPLVRCPSSLGQRISTYPSRTTSKSPPIPPAPECFLTPPERKRTRSGSYPSFLHGLGQRALHRLTRLSGNFSSARSSASSQKAALRVKNHRGEERHPGGDYGADDNGNLHSTSRFAKYSHPEYLNLHASPYCWYLHPIHKGRQQQRQVKLPVEVELVNGGAGI